MVTMPIAVPSTDEWITLYLSPARADRIRAGKSISKMTSEQIADLKRVLDHRKIEIKGRLAIVLQNANGSLHDVTQHQHIAPQQELGPASSNGHVNRTRKVFWGEDEWEFIVSRVSALTLKEPTTGLTNLAARIMQMMPEEQRRPQASLVTELSKRLVEYNRTKWLDVERDLQAAKSELERRKAAPSRQEVIDSLTDEEINHLTTKVIDNLSPFELCSRFSEQTILDCISPDAIIAQAFMRVVSHTTQHSMLLEENLTMLSRLLAELPTEKLRRQQQEKAAVPAKLPQVAFVGFKADQIAIVVDKLRGRIRVDVVDKNRSRFDSSADIIIMWKKFISHSFQSQITTNMKKGARLIRFDGGLENASKEIERALII
jgi:hypothetical protein